MEDFRFVMGFLAILAVLISGALLTIIRKLDRVAGLIERSNEMQRELHGQDERI